MTSEASRFEMAHGEKRVLVLEEASHVQAVKDVMTLLAVIQYEIAVLCVYRQTLLLFICSQGITEAHLQCK